ncbi:gluconokinase [Tumebacillus sp. ITR2]|uniref:Gluconokinase n=1 Tax=Tumebacillus amylolyticus TaxID=2801339 RepID=A0ABS1J6J1_9BACL|nr:gluconokinase [Tumebacillus amylolyticus]MBL0385900.1 gluconokinase [Tumebacillus amylolyticus]
MERKTCSLGLDIGTTSAKVIALAEDGTLITQRGHRLDLLHREDGAAEQDVTAVYAALMDVLSNVLTELRADNWHVRHVGFSAAMHSILAVDKAGTPLSHAVTWMDTRAKQSATDLWESETGKTIYTRTGTPVHPMSPLVKLHHWNQQRPEWVASIYKFVSIKEWIWHQWFGEWTVDASMASATGLYNVAEGAWDSQALQVAGVSLDQLSRVVPTTTCIPSIKSDVLRSLGFDEEVLFNIGATDGVLANLGVGAVEPHTLVLTIGTSSAVRVTSLHAQTNVDTRSFCYVLDGERFVLGGPSNAGGISVESLYAQVLAGIGVAWQPEELGAKLLEAGEVETRDLLCLPYVAGERAPLWAPEARASWIGIDRSHTGLHLLRAVVEGVLLNAYWIATSLFEMTGRPKKVMASGKLLEVAWIRQLMADIFGLPVYENQNGDASAVGAVWLAEIASGVRSLQDVLTTGQAEVSVTHPRTELQEHYQAKLERFQRLATFLN